MTGTNTWYYPSETGTSNSYGWMRLKFVETWNDDTNASSIAVTLQAKANYSGTDWKLYGTISLDGTTLFSTDGMNYSKATSSDWVDVASKTVSFAHDSEGKKTVRLVVAKTASYTSFIMMRSSYPLGLALTAATDYALHTNEVGGYVYIGGDKYDVYIGNGSSFDRCTPMFGNGSNYD